MQDHNNQPMPFRFSENMFGYLSFPFSLLLVDGTANMHHTQTRKIALQKVAKGLQLKKQYRHPHQ